MRQDHSAASIRQECEDSLRRLQTDVIDLYQMHWPPADNGPELEEAWQTMSDLQKEGKVRWIGVSNFDLSSKWIVPRKLPRSLRISRLTPLSAEKLKQRYASALLEKWHRRDQLRADGFRTAHRRDDPRARCCVAGG